MLRVQEKLKEESQKVLVLVTKEEERLHGEKDAVEEITMLAGSLRNVNGIKGKNVRSVAKPTAVKDVK